VNFETKTTRLERRVAELERELAATRKTAARATAQAQDQRLYERTPAIVTQAQQDRANVQRLLVLAGLSEQDPLWNTILSYADEHERNEADMAMRPDLTDAQRQYNSGRAASARDWATAIRDLRRAAITKTKGKE
jgi:hypothetical protein